jgi:hypothetical protein
MGRASKVIVGAVLVAAALAVSGLFVDNTFREWKARAESADSLAGVYLARAETAEGAARIFAARADSIAGVAGRRELVTRGRIREARRQPVPEPCDSVVSERDAIIDTLLVDVDDLNRSVELQRRALERLSYAYAGARAAADTLRAILAVVPSPRPAWVPTIGVGPIAGMCTNGPCVGVGVSLQWRVRLPWP